jgi:hypothetical protein
MIKNNKKIFKIDYNYKKFKLNIKYNFEIKLKILNIISYIIIEKNSEKIYFNQIK